MAVTPRTIVRNPLLMLIFTAAALFVGSMLFTCPLKTACKTTVYEPPAQTIAVHQVNMATAQAEKSAGYGWLGIEIQTMSSQRADQLGLHANHGVLVVSTQRNRPAQQAGIQTHDVILQFDGMAMRSACQLKNAVGKTAPGTRVPVTVDRDGKQITFYPVVTDRDGALGCGARCR